MAQSRTLSDLEFRQLAGFSWDNNVTAREIGYCGAALLAPYRDETVVDRCLVGLALFANEPSPPTRHMLLRRLSDNLQTYQNLHLRGNQHQHNFCAVFDAIKRTVWLSGSRDDTAMLLSVGLEAARHFKSSEVDSVVEQAIAFLDLNAEQHLEVNKPRADVRHPDPVSSSGLMECSLPIYKKLADVIVGQPHLRNCAFLEMSAAFISIPKLAKPESPRHEQPHQKTRRERFEQGVKSANQAIEELADRAMRQFTETVEALQRGISPIPAQRLFSEKAITFLANGTARRDGSEITITGPTLISNMRTLMAGGSILRPVPQTRPLL